MSFRVDAVEVEWLADTINKASRVAVADTVAVVKKGAVNIKKGMQRRTSGLAHAPALPRAINFDVYEMTYRTQAEIGPDKSRRQGALGNLVNYGSVNNPPHPFVEPAADEERPRFEQAMEDLSIRALGL